MNNSDLTSASRSRNMAAIRGKDTLPELNVRRMLHGLAQTEAATPSGLLPCREILDAEPTEVAFLVPVGSS